MYLVITYSNVYKVDITRIFVLAVVNAFYIYNNVF